MGKPISKNSTLYALHFADELLMAQTYDLKQSAKKR